jgi:uncharacterized protein YwgA
MEMGRLRNDVLILALLEKLREKGSWGGETHVQKASYFLKKLARVPINFDFIMYKHGPFSFDLRDELTAMRVDGFISLQPKNYFGPSMDITEQGQALKRKYSVTLKKYRKNIDFVANRLGDKGVSELEKLSTALFVIKQDPTRPSKNDRAARINELKPHVPIQEAESALATVDKIIKEFSSLV